MSVSEQLRGYADELRMLHEIPESVHHDLCMFADDVAEVESDLEERHVVTMHEHARVVHTYLDMIARRLDDMRWLEAKNAKLRELIEAILQCACEIKQDKSCDACPMYNEGGSWTDGDACLLRPTLLELGIEAD